MKKEVLVINYHKIVSEKDSEASAIENVFSVTDKNFEKQINILLKNNVTIVSLDDVINNTVSEDFSVAITVDDGNDSDFEIVYPKLMASGMKATFFLIANGLSIGAHAREIISNGFSIGSHGLSHFELTKLNREEQVYELEFSKKIIEEQVNLPINCFAYPFGIYNNELIERAKRAGYKAACTTDVKLNFPEDRPFLIHRWSIKHSTTIEEFEGMVTNKEILKRKIKTSKLKKGAKKLLGRYISDRLNVLFHS